MCKIIENEQEVEQVIKFDFRRFTEREYQETLERIKQEEYCDDYCGCIFAGNLCFDLILVKDEEISLNYDCYVGGSPGYSTIKIGNNQYPYDCILGGSLVLKTEERFLDYEEFKHEAEKQLLVFVRQEKGDILPAASQKPSFPWPSR